MGLITEEVEVGLNSGNIIYFENLGYTIPRSKKYFGKTVSHGSSIIVDVKDLKDNSNVRVEIKCDGVDCIKENYFLKFQTYFKQVHNDGKVYCQLCSHKLFGNVRMKQTKLENSISFYQWCIDNNRQDILDRWDYERNRSPKSYTYRTKEKIYLLCPNNQHESEIYQISSFTAGLNHGECRQCNCLEFNYPEFIFSWSDKNENLPSEYFCGSTKRLIWKCSEGFHDDYIRTVKNAIRFNFRCPECTRERKESFLQEKIRLYLEELSNKYDWNLNHETKCQLKCRNPKTTFPLHYDNEVIANKFNLITETHGKQHYSITNWHEKIGRKKNISAKKVLEYIQWKDEYKKQFALDNGYYYLAIPYTVDDQDETWKAMINDMLDYIYKNSSVEEI